MLPSLFQIATIKDLVSFVLSLVDFNPVFSVRAFCTSWTLYFLISSRICFVTVLQSSLYSLLLYCVASCFISRRFLSISLVDSDILSILMDFLLLAMVLAASFTIAIMSWL